MGIFSKTKRQQDSKSANTHEQVFLGENFDVRMKWFKDTFQQCSDITFHELTAKQTHCGIVYLNGMVDQQLFDEQVLKYIVSEEFASSHQELIHKLLDLKMVSSMSSCVLTDMKQASQLVLEGNILIFFKGDCRMLAFPLTNFEKRTISEPANENVIRGPRESFVEDIDTNLTMIRRIIKSPALKMEQQLIGSYTKTKVIICYIDGICKAELVEEVKQRLNRIQIDGVLGINYLEECIDDYPLSPFPQSQKTERPDVVAALGREHYPLLRPILVDKAKNGQIELTMTFPLPNRLVSNLAGGQSSSGNPYAALTYKGLNISEAFHKAQVDLPRRISFGQAKVLVIGDKMAKEGIVKILEFIIREPSLNLNMTMFVSPQKAKDILPMVPAFENSQTKILLGFTKNEITLHTTPKNFLETTNGNMIVSRLKIGKRKMLSEKGKEVVWIGTDGMALFHQYLDPLLIAIWSTMVYLKISFFFYLSAFILAQIFRLKDHRPLTFSLAAITAVMPFRLSENAANLNFFMETTWPTFAYFAESIPILYLLMDTLRRFWKKKAIKKAEG